MAGPETSGFHASEADSGMQNVQVQQAGEKLAAHKDFDIDALADLARIKNLEWAARAMSPETSGRARVDLLNAFEESEIATSAVASAWQRLPRSEKEVRRRRKLS